MAINKALNPYLYALDIPYSKIIVDNNGHPYEYEVEAEAYFRVYTSKARREFLYTNLTMWARDMLTAIEHFSIGMPQKNYIILTFDKIKALYNDKYSPRKYADTINELISFGLIDHKDKEKGQYWYNPQFFSPISRLNMYPDKKRLVNVKRN